MTHLILGGAALQRGDKRFVFSSGFSRWGDDSDFSPQPLQRYRIVVFQPPLLGAVAAIQLFALPVESRLVSQRLVSLPRIQEQVEHRILLGLRIPGGIGLRG